MKFYSTWLLLNTVYFFGGVGQTYAVNPIFSLFTAQPGGQLQVGTPASLSPTYSRFLKGTGIALGVAAVGWVLYAKIFRSRQSAHASNGTSQKTQRWGAAKQDMAGMQQLPAHVAASQFVQSLTGIQKILSDRYQRMPWVDGVIPSFPEKGASFFTQKMIIKPGAHLYVLGDIHGDANALEDAFKQLQSDGVVDEHFSIVKPGDRFLFLGDYTDRGKNGVGVFNFLSAFLEKNPQQVVLLRGNHEDLEINSGYGFYDEMMSRFGQIPAGCDSLLNRTYNMLPAALFCGYQKSNGTTGYILFCHGNVEFGYNPAKLLNSEQAYVGESLRELTKKENFDALPETVRGSTYGDLWESAVDKNIRTSDLQFLWGRYNLPTSGTQLTTYGNSGVYYAKDFVNAVLQQWKDAVNTPCTFEAIVRGHDHIVGAVKSRGIYGDTQGGVPLYTVISTCPDGVVTRGTQTYKAAWLVVDVQDTPQFHTHVLPL